MKKSAVINRNPEPKRYTSNLKIKTIAKATAKEMFEHFLNSPKVSHDFKDQIKCTGLEYKAIKELIKDQSSITFIHAAYTKDHHSKDILRKQNMLTIIIKKVDIKGKSIYIDIRDLKYTKPEIINGNLVDRPVHLCPPPPDCLILAF